MIDWKSNEGKILNAADVEDKLKQNIYWITRPHERINADGV